MYLHIEICAHSGTSRVLGTSPVGPPTWLPPGPCMTWKHGSTPEPLLGPPSSVPSPSVATLLPCNPRDSSGLSVRKEVMQWRSGVLLSVTRRPGRSPHTIAWSWGSFISLLWIIPLRGYPVVSVPMCLSMDIWLTSSFTNKMSVNSSWAPALNVRSTPLPDSLPKWSCQLIRPQQVVRSMVHSIAPDLAVRPHC